MRPITSSRSAGLRLSTLLVSVLTLGAVGSARAGGVVDLPNGDFEPLRVTALEDGVPLRSEPGYLYKELKHVARGTELLVDKRSGDWLHVLPEGWVLLEYVEMPKRKPAEQLIEVVQSGARVREGAGTSFPIVRTLDSGVRLRAVRDGEWWVLRDGGHLFASLAQPVKVGSGSRQESPTRSVAKAPSAGAGGSSSSPGKYRWSYMDLQGVLFEVTPIDARSGLEPALRQAMAKTGVMESDWTFLRVAITVPSGPYRFNYSPSRNSIHVLTPKAEPYGSVYASGPVDRLPKGLREFFMPHVVQPGERFEGVLLFRPTLKLNDIAELGMRINNRLNRFFKG